MKGIILAGGTGSRLYPLTKSTSKQLLLVNDRPMIHYPISTLIDGGITDILVITNKEYLSEFKNLLGDGSDYGVKLSYEVQFEPRGIADAFIVGENFISKENVCLILGDNLFFSSEMKNIFSISKNNLNKGISTIVGCEVSEPERYGVMVFDKNNVLSHIEEKPNNPKSNYAVSGLYFYTNDIINFAKNLTPSKRGELEITDINNIYLSNKKMNVQFLDNDSVWLDTGTIEALEYASSFVKTFHSNQ
jgi:glucose-1-phosphate thymidylyltransferase